MDRVGFHFLWIPGEWTQWCSLGRGRRWPTQVPFCLNAQLSSGSSGDKIWVMGPRIMLDEKVILLSLFFFFPESTKYINLSFYEIKVHIISFEPQRGLYKIHSSLCLSLTLEPSLRGQTRPVPQTFWTVQPGSLQSCRVFTYTDERQPHPVCWPLRAALKITPHPQCTLTWILEYAHQEFSEFWNYPWLFNLCF